MVIYLIRETVIRQPCFPSVGIICFVVVVGGDETGQKFGSASCRAKVKTESKSKNKGGNEIRDKQFKIMKLLM